MLSTFGFVSFLFILKSPNGMVIGFGISTVKVKNGYSSIPTVVVVVAFPLILEVVE